MEAGKAKKEERKEDHQTEKKHPLVSSLPEDHAPKKPKMSSSATTTEDESEITESTIRKLRHKRRKIALFIAYCGVGYQGMQRNPGAKTIEGDLELALFRSGAIPESDYGDPRKVDWMRSARTDKGVSAIGQVVSGRFYIDPPGFVERLNSNLPPQIVALGYKRVTASFNAKKFCDRRRYVYLLPVFALDPTAHPDRESVVASEGSENALVKCLECSERGRKVDGVMGSRRNGQNWNGGDVVSGKSLDEVKGNVEIAYSEEVSESKETDGSVSIILEAKEGNGLSPNPGNEVSLSSGLAKLSNSAKGVISSVDIHVELEESLHGESLGKIQDLEAGSEGKQTENGNHLDAKLEETKVGGDKKLVECNENAVGRSSTFCYAEKEKERFNRILKMYVGTHNFHNLTTRTKAEDPSASRYILSFEANEVVTIDDIDFVKCVVLGQSFMLHQIRKMIGLAVAVMRGCAPESILTTALRKDVNINVPTAPELGLFLEECLYTSYNQKWKDSHEELSLERYAEQVEAFKMKHIYNHIASTERQEGVVALWLHSLNHRNYPDFRMEDSKEDKADGGVIQSNHNAELC